MTCQEASLRRYECEVCDKPLRAKTQEQLEQKLASWFLHSFMHSMMGRMDILTCPQCATLSPQSMVEARMIRIRTGRDRSYH